MAEKPIILNADEVRAALAGRLGMIWRPVKPPFEVHPNGYITKPTKHERLNPYLCPLGAPGDRLWVRETWASVPRTAYAHSEGVQQTLHPTDNYSAAIYRLGFDRAISRGIWLSPAAMPRWASRMLLEVKADQVKPVQEITEDEAIASGIESEAVHVPPPIGSQLRYIAPGVMMTNAYGEREDHAPAHLTAKKAMECWWQARHGKLYPWDGNPWAWGVTVEVVNNG